MLLQTPRSYPVLLGIVGGSAVQGHQQEQQQQDKRQQDGQQQEWGLSETQATVVARPVGFRLPATAGPSEDAAGRQPLAPSLKQPQQPQPWQAENGNPGCCSQVTGGSPFSRPFTRQSLSSCSSFSSDEGGAQGGLRDGGELDSGVVASGGGAGSQENTDARMRGSSGVRVRLAGAGGDEFGGTCVGRTKRRRQHLDEAQEEQQVEDQQQLEESEQQQQQQNQQVEEQQQQVDEPEGEAQELVGAPPSPRPQPAAPRLLQHQGWPSQRRQQQQQQQQQQERQRPPAAVQDPPPSNAGGKRPAARQRAKEGSIMHCWAKAAARQAYRQGGR
jgi:hypothetical protein